MLTLTLILATPAWTAAGAPAETRAAPPLAGLPLADALRELGLDVFFTSFLVRPEMRVVTEPVAAEPRAVLDEILAAHGLEAIAGPGDRLVVVAAAPRPAEARAGNDDRRTATPIPLIRDEIVVTPSRISLLGDAPVAAVDLDRGDIFALPHLGDDVFRALTLLPGVSGEETSARFSVRGGRTDEVLVLLDRVELFEPYHLKDYSSMLSIIAPRTLREVNLLTGGFPAQYGDRMSGVLDMSTVEPQTSSSHLGIGVLTAEAGSSGSFAGERGHWLGSLRRGNLDLTFDYLGIKEQPRYWDGFAKAELRPWPRQRFGVHALHSDDGLDFDNVDPDNTERYLTGYGNAYVWLTHQALLGDALLVDSTASLGRVDRDRRGVERELEPGNEGQGFNLVDRRGFDAATLEQDWSFSPAGSDGSGGHLLGWGWELRELDTRYDYMNARVFDDPLAAYRAVPRTGTTRFDARLRGRQASGYLSDRVRLRDDLTLELGLRYDAHTLTRDRSLSPRLNLVHDLGRGGVVRAAWGYFFQSQRPYELQVEDGVTELAGAERTEQRVLGYERAFRGDLLLRVEAYQREIRDPRPRYENLFEPVSIFPEIEPDRVLVAPERGASYGLEVFLRGAAGPRVEWWLSYAYSRVRDEIDGRSVPRRIDQPHALNADLNLRAGAHWNVNLAWRFHTGWPTTAVAGRLQEDDDGELEIVPVLGPLYAERLPPYHRLDLRASREWRTRRGVLGFFVEVQNVYDRGNVAGFDVDFEFGLRSDGSIDVTALEEIWGGILPSFGITWEF